LHSGGHRADHFGWILANEKTVFDGHANSVSGEFINGRAGLSLTIDSVLRNKTFRLKEAADPRLGQELTPFGVSERPECRDDPHSEVQDVTDRREEINGGWVENKPSGLGFALAERPPKVKENKPYGHLEYPWEKSMKKRRQKRAGWQPIRYKTECSIRSDNPNNVNS
jgi:hypothetical protein